MSIKQLLTLLASGFICAMVLQPAYAQTTVPTTAATATPVPTTAVQTTPTPTSTARKDMNKALKEFRTTTREAMKASIQQLKLNNATRREQFKNRLSLIKDERKKVILERIDTKISSINTNRTERMDLAIDRLEELLKALKDKAALAKLNGVDTTAVDQAIVDAENALAAASNALAAQTAKTYPLEVTDETAKSKVGETFSQMAQDLKSVHQKVVDAKKAVLKVAQELHKVWKGVTLTVTPTGSVTTQPTPTVTATATTAPTAVPTTTQ